MHCWHRSLEMLSYIRFKNLSAFVPEKLLGAAIRNLYKFVFNYLIIYIFPAASRGMPKAEWGRAYTSLQAHVYGTKYSTYYFYKLQLVKNMLAHLSFVVV